MKEPCDCCDKEVEKNDLRELEDGLVCFECWERILLEWEH